MIYIYIYMIYIYIYDIYIYMQTAIGKKTLNGKILTLRKIRQICQYFLPSKFCAIQYVYLYENKVYIIYIVTKYIMDGVKLYNL